MTVKTRSYAIYYHGSKTPSLVRACSLDEARSWAVPLSKIFFPDRPTRGIRVTLFRGNSGKGGFPRNFVLSLLRWMPQ